MTSAITNNEPQAENLPGSAHDDATDEIRPGPEPASEPAAARVRTGPEVIAGYLKTLPGAPGVYRMIDADGTSSTSARRAV